MARQWSPEQRQAARDRLTQARAAKLAKRQQNVTQEVEAEVTALPSRDEANDELKSLAALLYKSADDKEQRNRVLDQLENFLGRLQAKDYPELMQSEVVQKFIESLGQRKAEENKDDAPGTIYNRGLITQYKKPWTERDLMLSPMGLITFEVSENEVVVWNGIRRDYEPGVEYTDYKCFVDTMRERSRNLRMAAEHAEYMFKQRNTLSDRSIAGIGTARVRGTADHGSYRPAAGLFEPQYNTEGEPE